MSTISLRCKSCDGVLEVDEDREVLSCPYCGSKELLVESDEVKIERIRTKAHTDVEMEKLKNEAKKPAEKRKDILNYILVMIALMIAYAVINRFI